MISSIPASFTFAPVLSTSALCLKLVKSAICVAFFAQFLAEAAALPPVLGHPDLGLLMPCFKFPESGPCRGVGHHVAVFDLAHGLSANAYQLGQPRLRYASFTAQGPEASGSLGFSPWPSVHFPGPFRAIVRQENEKCNRVIIGMLEAYL
jgi:hypothetical protein